MKFDKDNWRDHNDIITDSLWLIDRRDEGGSSSYPGNFLPQIPYQLIMRYTDVGDTVLDPFAGSGTTADVALKLDRHSISFDITPTRPYIVQRDAAGPSYKDAITTPVELCILHPPYSSIIVYSLKNNDLSNPYLSVENYLSKLSQVALNCKEVMAPKAKLALVIGDMYTAGHVVPLGFMCMETILMCGLKLKAIVVKNFGDTMAKRNLQHLWRYRALVNGFYIFKHEYIMVFD